MEQIAWIGLVAVLGMLPGNPAGNQVPSGQDKKAEQELMRIEYALPEAVLQRDTATLGRILADDFVGFNPAGTKLTKADVLGQTTSADSELESLRHEDVEVRAFGNTAVATGVTVVKGRHRGQEASGRFRYMHVLVKRRGRWQIVAAQSAALATD